MTIEEVVFHCEGCYWESLLNLQKQLTTAEFDADDIDAILEPYRTAMPAWREKTREQIVQAVAAAERQLRRSDTNGSE